MSDKEAHSLGSYLREKREAAGISGGELARRVGINDGYLNRIERGERQKPASDVLQRIVDELGLDPAEAFAYIGVKPAALMPTRRDFFRSTYGVSEAQADDIVGMLDDYVKTHKKEEANDNANHKDDD